MNGFSGTPSLEQRALKDHERPLVLKQRLGLMQRLSDDRGVSAVEFALVAPVLLLALLGSVDLGMAEYERMTMDHALRSGAQAAILDPGAASVLNKTQSTISRNFALNSTSTLSDKSVSVSATRFCACPEANSIEVACSTTCTGSAPTFVYYRLTAAKMYKGAILPTLTLSASAQVQIR